jgi:hypothetical protein
VAGLVGGEGFAFVPRRGRCVDDFVTFPRQHPARLTSTIDRKSAATGQSGELLRSASLVRRETSKINDGERSLHAPGYDGSQLLQCNMRFHDDRNLILYRAQNSPSGNKSSKPSV